MSWSAVVERVILVAFLLSASCQGFRFNGAHNAQDAKNIGGSVTTVRIESNAPGAVFHSNGGLSGKLPLSLEYVFDSQSYSVWGPDDPSMLEKAPPRPGERRFRVIFNGRVSAPGYQSVPIRVWVAGDSRAHRYQDVRCRRDPNSRSCWWW